MTASELDALLAVARKHRVRVLKIEGVLGAELEYIDGAQDGVADVSHSVINGGWKRGPNLEE